MLAVANSDNPLVWFLALSALALVIGTIKKLPFLTDPAKRIPKLSYLDQFYYTSYGHYLLIARNVIVSIILYLVARVLAE